MEYNTIFKKVANYKELHVYQKSDVLVLLTDVFCKRFLPARGDRTVDQMNMAARSGKQNIVEGSEAALTSSETELKLVNVGRSSFQELREDYQDLGTHLRRPHAAGVGTAKQTARSHGHAAAVHHLDAGQPRTWCHPRAAPAHRRRRTHRRPPHRPAPAQSPARRTTRQ